MDLTCCLRLQWHRLLLLLTARSWANFSCFSAEIPRIRRSFPFEEECHWRQSFVIPTGELRTRGSYGDLSCRNRRPAHQTGDWFSVGQARIAELSERPGTTDEGYRARCTPRSEFRERDHASVNEVSKLPRLPKRARPPRRYLARASPSKGWPCATSQDLPINKDL